MRTKAWRRRCPPPDPREPVHDPIPPLRPIRWPISWPRTGAPSFATLAGDLAGTYRQVADWLGCAPNHGLETKRVAGAGLHADLAALAATAGDSLSTREHYLTAARLAAAPGAELDAIASADAQLAAQPSDNCVYAVYDLAAGPVTYDFIYFLMLAEHFRATSGRLGLYVVFVPAEGDGFRHSTSRYRFLERDRKLWRLLNLLAPCASLVTNCIGMHVCASRADAATFLRDAPAEARVPDPIHNRQAGLPVPAAARPCGRQSTAPISAPCRHRRWRPSSSSAGCASSAPAGRWSRSRCARAISNRMRNSNVAAWRQFAGRCTQMGFHPCSSPIPRRY